MVVGVCEQNPCRRPVGTQPALGTMAAIKATAALSQTGDDAQSHADEEFDR